MFTIIFHFLLAVLCPRWVNPLALSCPPRLQLRAGHRCSRLIIGLKWWLLGNPEPSPLAVCSPRLHHNASVWRTCWVTDSPPGRASSLTQEAPEGGREGGTGHMTTGSVRRPAASDATLCCCAGVCVLLGGWGLHPLYFGTWQEDTFCIAVLKWTDRLPYECVCVCASVGCPVTRTCRAGAGPTCVYFLLCCFRVSASLYVGQVGTVVSYDWWLSSGCLFAVGSRQVDQYWPIVYLTVNLVVKPEM